MQFKYIWSLGAVLLLTACSSSHTDKIKEQLDYQYDEQVYIEQGGEAASKHRVKVFCELIADKKVVKEQLQLSAMRELTGNELRLINAEIILADKECK